jgi:lysophospholipase L1-like esterase
MVRRWAAVGTGLGVVCGLFLAVVPFHAATKKKTRRPAAPPVSAAARAKALSRVDEYLAASADTSLEQPGALAPVSEAFFRLNSGQTRDPVHVIHFGDSHTAADEWTGVLRDLFQQRFGNGGSGFSLAGHPFLGYRRFDARGGGTAGWHSEGLRTGSGDGFFGLGGISISAASAHQSVYLQAECARIEIDYLQQPGGGSLVLYDGEQRMDEFSTEGDLGPGFVSYQTPSGPHRFTLVTQSARPVRLFGWVADQDAGVTYEALGINGAEASLMLKWDEAMLATYLQRRNPGLIVLAYGANEASDPSWRSSENYQAMFASLLQRLRRASATASILVLGPGDRWAQYRGKWRQVPGINGIVAAQRNACREFGCTFWDTRQRMGGEGAMRDWITAGLAQPDHVHFTAAGYHRLAAVLFQDLIGQYETYKKVRLETADQASHGQANQDH